MRKTGGSRNGGRRASMFYRFYLIKPPRNANADKLAEELIGIRDVEEVFVTDGDYGFLVKARFFSDREPDDACRYIESRLSGSYGKITSHYQYTK